MITDWKDWSPEMVEAHNARVRRSAANLPSLPSPEGVIQLRGKVHGKSTWRESGVTVDDLPPAHQSVKGKCPSEEIDQIALARWLDEHFPGDWFHVPNGGQRNVIVGKKLKAQGVKPGVPDNFIVRPTKGAPGVIVELKRIKGGVVSPEQMDWTCRLRAYGWIVGVCKGFEEARRFIMEAYGR